MMTNEPIPLPYRIPPSLLIAAVLAFSGCDTPAGRENGSAGGTPPNFAGPAPSFDQQAADVQAGRTTAIRADATSLSDAQKQALGTLTALKQLELPRVKLDDAAARQVATLANLESVVFGETTIGDDGWRALTSLKRLKRLNVAKCEITDAALTGMSSLVDLELLRFGSSRVTDAGVTGIAKLPKLRHLIIRFAPITDAGLKPLAEANQLESLYLEGTQVTEAGERDLLRIRPDLHVHFP